jgi:hydroxymethylpyrimidine pyrophosphatase-like HAD family hydrolase
MRYRALATDYDGTIAHDGLVAGSTLEALRRLKQSGRRLILVTGRELDDLQKNFSHCELFDRIVAENGALLYNPASRESRMIAPAPPPRMVQELQLRGVPISVGRSIVATVEPHEHALLSVIHDLGLEWHVIFNKGAVMALPSGITKATGLLPALEELGVDPHRTVAVGDAENDHAFFRLCGIAVAVANALPALKAAADLITENPRGAGVAELIDKILADGFADVRPRVDAHQPSAMPGPGTRIAR